MDTTTRTDLDAVTNLAAVLPFLPPPLTITIRYGITELHMRHMDDARTAAAVLGLTNVTAHTSAAGNVHTTWDGDPDVIPGAAFTVVHCALAGA